MLLDYFLRISFETVVVGMFEHALKALLVDVLHAEHPRYAQQFLFSFVSQTLVIDDPAVFQSADPDSGQRFPAGH